MKMKVLVFLAALAVINAAPQNRPLTSLEFDRYWTLDEIYDFMDEVDGKYPDIVEVEMMGRTSEGREIRGLRITNEALLTESTQVILVTAGISARDWISTMTAVNLMHELTEHYYLYEELVDNIDWFILPVANPDGYVFSFTEGNRAWVKNRNVNPGSDCFGVNINRNFDFVWGIEGMANCDYACCENFQGPEADSEEETRTIQFIVDITRRLQHAHITLKAGTADVSSLIAFPFAFSNEAFMPNFDEQRAVGNLMTNSIFETTGQRYEANSESNVIGFISGSSSDYAAGRDQIPLVYTIYAPSGGANGWDVPENRITDIVRGIFEGVRVVGDYIVRNFDRNTE